ncbi:ankyrin repeat domain-containing protein [Legionella taurinensis]|uniref:Ankyrin repeat domain-containing protein n=1 Tax=Legionella taurinensis TaxID=70611 RepID=A0AB38N7M3_9GAMM|nr:ankyrin repeat domain-containing protein [Legionella taurinensis]MDX1837254.1 ankyrin repeat domain-containing protein [Legionella taurinensis]PUT40273.1 hypothetical protein DB744_06630 [Legionella taurinensis]PUT41507.1 hypothetical protein DB746_09140 [Legionella taurinensis]PUT44373.1 hypothetical protein DB743_08355 [Legionella taurinensis]PUT48335.1 hypothetical protein DB745_05030 [Legionella taurinensis]
MPNPTDDIRLILNLGIRSELVPKDLTHEQYQALHRRLATFKPDLIKAHWQCLAIAGDERAYANLEQVDHRGATMGHYAALSENIPALTRVRKKSTALFYRKDAAGRNMAHYAVLSRNPNILDWIDQNKPLKHKKLLSASDQLGWTIAHYAAWLGDVRLLAWIRDKRPQVLEAKDRKGLTPAHYAAESQEPQALRWFADNAPHLLNTQPSIAANALSSANQLNLALALSPTPHQIDCTNLDEERCKRLIFTLGRALQTNYRLTRLTNYPKLTLEDNDQARWVTTQLMEIRGLLAMNKTIAAELNKLSYRLIFILTRTDYFLPREIWHLIFSLAVGAVSLRIPQRDIDKQFGKLVTRVERQETQEKNGSVPRSPVIQPSASRFGFFKHAPVSTGAPAAGKQLARFNFTVNA